MLPICIYVEKFATLNMLFWLELMFCYWLAVLEQMILVLLFLMCEKSSYLPFLWRDKEFDNGPILTHNVSKEAFFINWLLLYLPVSFQNEQHPLQVDRKILDITILHLIWHKSGIENDKVSKYSKIIANNYKLLHPTEYLN